MRGRESSLAGLSVFGAGVSGFFGKFVAGFISTDDFGGGGSSSSRLLPGNVSRSSVAGAFESVLMSVSTENSKSPLDLLRLVPV